MKVIVKETGSDKWLILTNEVKFTSNEQEATRFNNAVDFNVRCLDFPSLLNLQDKKCLKMVVTK